MLIQRSEILCWVHTPALRYHLRVQGVFSNFSHTTRRRSFRYSGISLTRVFYTSILILHEGWSWLNLVHRGCHSLRFLVCHHFCYHTYFQHLEARLMVSGCHHSATLLHHRNIFTHPALVRQLTCVLFAWPLHHLTSSPAPLSLSLLNC